MNLNDLGRLSEAQRTAFLDLAVLTMYVDAHLASAEDARVQAMLTGMGYASEHDRNREYDASVARIRPHAENVEAAQSYAAELLAKFPSSQWRMAIQVVDELTKADRAVSEQEVGFVQSLKRLVT